MSPDSLRKLQQAFPKLIEPTNVQCDDRWFPLLMSFLPKLEILIGERPVAERASFFINRIEDTDTGLQFQMSKTNPEIEDLLLNLDAHAAEFLKKDAGEHTYLWTHNPKEQTHAEEAVRSDKDRPTSIAEMQRKSVEQAKSQV
jgi:hypothetical protein